MHRNKQLDCTGLGNPMAFCRSLYALHPEPSGTLRANEVRGQRRLGDVHQGVLCREDAKPHVFRASRGRERQGAAGRVCLRACSSVSTFKLRCSSHIAMTHADTVFCTPCSLASKSILYVLDGLAHGDAISRDNRLPKHKGLKDMTSTESEVSQQWSTSGRWVDVVLYQIIGPL